MISITSASGKFSFIYRRFNTGLNFSQSVLFDRRETRLAGSSGSVSIEALRRMLEGSGEVESAEPDRALSGWFTGRLLPNCGLETSGAESWNGGLGMSEGVLGNWVIASCREDGE